MKIGKVIEVARCGAFGRRRAEMDHQEDGQNADAGLHGQAHPARDPRRGLFGDLGVVVQETQAAEDQGDQQHHPDIDVAQVHPQQGGHGDPGQEHQAAHGRRAGLFGDVALDTVGADRLALALLGLHPADEARAHGDDDQLRGRHGHAASERQVAQQIEHRHVVVMLGQPLVEQIEHQPPSPATEPSAAKASARTFAFRSREPFTITVSPGSTAWQTSGGASPAASSP